MRIRLNGSWQETQSLTLHGLQDEYYEKNNLSKEIQIVIIYNGFQTAEDFPLQAEDQVVFIRKGKMPDEKELESMLSARITPGLYEKFQKGRVAIAGLGGLGSQIAMQLARSGVGHLHLLDFDVVEPSNLNRQQYRICHLGMEKTQALAQELAEIAPYVTVTTDTVRLTAENALGLLAEDTIICEAFDNPAAKAMLAECILVGFPEKYYIGASGMAGCEDSNTIVTKKITDHFYMCGDGVTGAQLGRGLMAPRVAICASHQANQVLQILQKME